VAPKGEASAKEPPLSKEEEEEGKREREAFPSPS